MIKNIINYYKLNKELKTILLSKCNILVLTGAGASKDSGIETFRDKKGVWKKYDLNQVCRPESFLKNPQLVLDFYNQRRSDYFQDELEPNDIHKSLFVLEKNFKNFNIITQNIDDLHEQAGSRNVLHIHGMLWMDKCHSCLKMKHNKQDILFPNVCSFCGEKNKQRPHVVFFKELPLYGNQVESLVNNAHIFISIGTSGSVYPAAGYARRIQQNGCLTININKEVPKNVDSFKYFFKGGSFWVSLVSRLLLKYNL